MNQDLSWQEKNYSIVITDDGSPSLHWKQSLEAIGELMHHRGGALSETEEIYGKVIVQGLLLGMTSFISVGLGLGYNELMVAREILRRGFAHRLEEFRLLSFEADSFLAEKFLRFVLESGASSPLHSQILWQMAPGQEPQVLEILRELHRAERWQIQGALHAQALPENPYEVALYDAFSSKTNPELWGEEFLQLFLQQAMSPQSLFSTYACTGVLKRSLKACGFEVLLREGFHGKRNSTLGCRLGSASAVPKERRLRLEIF